MIARGLQLDLFPPHPACEAAAPRAPLLRLQVVRVRSEGSSPLALRQMRGSSDVYAAFRRFCDAADRESFWSVMLDVKHRVIAVEEVARGSLSSTLVHPRETFKSAIIVNAAAVVVLHNHPSGDPTPSAEDLSLTRRLQQAGELLGIPVLDHVVIARDGYVSLVDSGYV